MSNSPDSVLTIREAADCLRVSQRTVYRLVTDGRMPCFKVGSNWRFKRGDIDEWITAQSGEADIDWRVRRVVARASPKG